jgi:hypothetical protein
MPSPLVLAMTACAVLSAVLIVAGLAALRRRRWIGMSAAMTLALLALALAAVAGTVSMAMRGYQALTREVVAATVMTHPTGPGQFTATFTFPDGRQDRFDLTGDAVYVDAHIVKWHPLVNFLGLHTAYQLDRVGGRYDRIEDEQMKPRRIFPLSVPTPVDIFQLARALTLLRPLVDAEYGSATFQSAREPAELELRVSTSGLLFRRRDDGGR